MQNDEAKFRQEDLRERFQRLAGRHENGTAPRAIAVPQLFQTPRPVAAQLVSMLYLNPGARVLEPSAGLGRILDALQPLEPREVVAVDIEKQCCEVLYNQNRPGVEIKQRDFLALFPSDIGYFDGIVMNPPFTMRSDIRHILHALSFLQRGGRLAAICLDDEKRRAVLQPLSKEWVRLPADTFKETGTRVATAMLMIQQ